MNAAVAAKVREVAEVFVGAVIAELKLRLEPSCREQLITRASRAMELAVEGECEEIREELLS